MAHLFRPKYTQKIPLSGAEFTTRNGVRQVSWTGKKGKKVIGIVSSKDPTRCTITTDCWWIEYRDHEGKLCREKAFADERASLKKMHGIEDRIEAIKGGNLSPASQRRAGKLLCDLIAEFGDAMATDDTSPKQIKLVTGRVTRIAEHIEATAPADFSTATIAKALRHFRDTSPKFSPQTSNHYLKQCHSFVLWCVRQGYLDADPMRDATPVEVDSRRTYDRRALTIEEVGRLLDATRGHTQHKCPLSGEDRAALYATAIYTGLRCGELASLTRASFQLVGPSPMISVHGRSTKNKKPRHQPLPDNIAAMLRPWLASRPKVGPVWTGYDWRNGKAANMLRRDLLSAGIHLDTEAGRVDFHSLRTTYGTLLALAGVPIQHAQRLMDHSDPKLTAKHYTKLLASDLAGMVGKMATPDHKADHKEEK